MGTGASAGASSAERLRATSGVGVCGALLFGAGWGVAQILFGISVRRLGAVLGTLVPLFLGQRRLVPDSAVTEIVCGVTVMVLGIALTTWGGKLRERSGMKEITGEAPTSGYAAAVLLAILCGFMAPMSNYAFAVGQQVAVQAVALGNSPVRAAHGVWPIALFGGLIPNVAYSVWLLQKGDSWSLFRKTPSDASWPVLMAVLWMGAFALYGMSSVYLGSLGTSLGWVLFQIFMIMRATLSGVMTGEWKRASRAALLLLALGMASLVGATVLLAAGRR
jgi:L-rhamnose-H+ transport protein